jgi:hypothetical protein
MKITMLQTVPGSVDGIRVSTYEAGIEYDLSATDGARSLAAAFVGAGMAEVTGDSKDAVDAEPATASAEPTRAKPGRKPKQ